MVLTSANSGKYLMRKWHDDRAAALVDRSRFTTEELDWLEIGATEGIVSEANPEVFMIDTQPIDPLTSPSKFDIRKLPGRS